MLKFLFALYFSIYILSVNTTNNQSKFIYNFLKLAKLSTIINLENRGLNEIKISKNTNYNLLETSLQQSIQDEVHRTFRRLKPIFNTWLIILLMLSTGGVAWIWLLLGKLAKETEVCSQEIDSIKYDTLSQINYISADAKNVLSEIQENLIIAKQQKLVVDPTNKISPPREERVVND